MNDKQPCKAIKTHTYTLYYRPRGLSQEGTDPIMWKLAHADWWNIWQLSNVYCYLRVALSKQGPYGVRCWSKMSSEPLGIGMFREIFSHHILAEMPLYGWHTQSINQAYRRTPSQPCAPLRTCEITLAKYLNFPWTFHERRLILVFIHH